MAKRNMMAWGLAYLTQQLEESASVDLQYKRGADSVMVRAMLGRKLLNTSDIEGGYCVQVTELDLIIPAALLVLGGVEVAPAVGDLVGVPGRLSIEWFEVRPYGGDSAYFLSDPHGSCWRLHCKRVDLGAD